MFMVEVKNCNLYYVPYILVNIDKEINLIYTVSGEIKTCGTK